MKIQCDVCEKAQATVICCADEAALCAKCDIEVHAANKLASKHQRLLLQCLSNKLPPCDICQEKAAFIFCVEDRALLCKDCDEPIHASNSLSANHQRFLATGIRVALGSSCGRDIQKSHMEPPNQKKLKPTAPKLPAHQSPIPLPYQWAVDDLLSFSDVESSDKKGHFEFGDFAWLPDIDLFSEELQQEALPAAEVPQLSVPVQSDYVTSYRPMKPNTSYKKPRLEVRDEDEEPFIVPDLG